MTLHELFTTINEASMFSSFFKFYPQIRTTGYMNNFRFLFHSLRLIQSGVDDGEKIEIDYYDRYWHEQGIAAWFNIDNGWQILLAREVIFAPELPKLTMEDVAALCLWRIAFLEFSEEQHIWYKDYQLNKEGYNYHEKFLMKCSQWHFGRIPVMMRKNPPLNGPKRHRYTRLKQLYRYDCIEETCEYINRHQIEDIDNLWQLKRSNKLFIYDFPYSSYFSQSNILSSYKSLLADFTNTHKYHNIFLISHSEDDNNLIAGLVSYIQNYFPNSKIYYGTNSTKGITMRLIQYSER